MLALLHLLPVRADCVRGVVGKIQPNTIMFVLFVVQCILLCNICQFVLFIACKSHFAKLSTLPCFVQAPRLKHIHLWNASAACVGVGVDGMDAG